MTYGVIMYMSTIGVSRLFTRLGGHITTLQRIDQTTPYTLDSVYTSYSKDLPGACNSPQETCEMSRYRALAR